MASSLLDRLVEGAGALGVALSPAQAGSLLDYQELILKWNRVYNLTAVRSAEEMLTHHLLDSVAVVPAVRRSAAGRPARLLDVGSGAGLPGVVIAVCCPELRVDCVDTVAKKAAFVQQAAAQLKLPNLRGLHARVEELQEAYDLAISRAFASLADFVAWSRKALSADGQWLAMKGKYPESEIKALPPDIEVFHVEQLQVPGLEAERCLLSLRRRGAATAGA